MHVYTFPRTNICNNAQKELAVNVKISGVTVYQRLILLAEQLLQISGRMCTVLKSGEYSGEITITRTIFPVQYRVVIIGTIAYFCNNEIVWRQYVFSVFLLTLTCPMPCKIVLQVLHEN